MAYEVMYPNPWGFGGAVNTGGITGSTLKIIHSGLFFENMKDSNNFNLFVSFVFLSSDFVSRRSFFV